MDIDSKIKDNQKIVWQVIHDLKYVPEFVDQEDLFQVGLISLWKAIESYQEDSKFALSTHCYTNIKGDLLNYLRSEQSYEDRQERDSSGISDSFEEELIESMLVDEIKKILTEREFEIFSDLYINEACNNDLAEKKYGVHRSTLYREGALIKEKIKRKLDWN